MRLKIHWTINGQSLMLIFLSPTLKWYFILEIESRKAFTCPSVKRTAWTEVNLMLRRRFVAQFWSLSNGATCIWLVRMSQTSCLCHPKTSIATWNKKCALNYYLLNKCLCHELKYDREPSVNCKPNLIRVHDISSMFANIICREVVINSFSVLINSISVCNLSKI